MSRDLPTPDVIDLLLEQHAQAEQLFKLVMNTTGGQRADAFYELVRLLSVHETAEEMLVHPLARRTIEAGASVIDARLAEEHDAKKLLADLHETGVDSPDFLPGIARLRDAVLTHATYEERYEFTALREFTPRAVLVALAPAVRAAEAVAPTRPHPGAESLTMNALLGPLASVTDRIRDVLRAELAKADAATAARR